MILIASIVPQKSYAEEPRNLEFSVNVNYYGGTLHENDFSFKLTPTSYTGCSMNVRNDSSGIVTFNVPYTDSDVRWKETDESGKQTGYLIYSLEQL